MKPLSFFITWLACCQLAFGIAGSWNGVAVTAWNGIAQTSWNGTGVSQAAGGGTSYTNAGGSGSRTGSITVTLTGAFNGVGSAGGFVDGLNAANNLYFGINAATSYGMKFDFGSARVIDEAKFYQENTTSHGTWKWQGSSDGSTWTDIGGSFTFGGVATQTQTSLNGNVTAYRYYQVIGVSGTCSDSPWLYEYEFKIN